jgi:hypothetical protein
MALQRERCRFSEDLQREYHVPKSSRFAAVNLTDAQWLGEADDSYLYKARRANLTCLEFLDGLDRYFGRMTGRLIATNPALIVARANTFQELIARLKANAATATQGTAGLGNASHVSGVYFQAITGTRFQFVPYRGAGPAMQDLVAGQIDMMRASAKASTTAPLSRVMMSFDVPLGIQSACQVAMFLAMDRYCSAPEARRRLS